MYALHYMSNVCINMYTRSHIRHTYGTWSICTMQKTLLETVKTKNPKTMGCTVQGHRTGWEVMRKISNEESGEETRVEEREGVHTADMRESSRSIENTEPMANASVRVILEDLLNSSTSLTNCTLEVFTVKAQWEKGKGVGCGWWWSWENQGRWSDTRSTASKALHTNA